MSLKLRFNSGRNMNIITLTSPNSNATARITEFGAHVTSWVVNGDERLYLSPRSALDDAAVRGTAIRGGVPIIFPQFSTEGLLPRHGFARTMPWQCINVSAGQAHFQLDANAATQSIWPHRFCATFRVTVSANTLALELRVTNTDTQAMRFTCALHTYLRVIDIRQTHVHGLCGTRYRISGTAKDALYLDEAALLRFDDEVDRIYTAAPKTLHVREGEFNRVTTVHKTGFADCVVWNPWAAKHAALALKDMPPDGYLEMVCIEAAQVQTPVQLGPGESWAGVQELVAVFVE